MRRRPRRADLSLAFAAAQGSIGCLLIALGLG